MPSCYDNAVLILTCSADVQLLAWITRSTPQAAASAFTQLSRSDKSKVAALFISPWNRLQDGSAHLLLRATCDGALEVDTRVETPCFIYCPENQRVSVETVVLLNTHHLVKSYTCYYSGGGVLLAIVDIKCGAGPQTCLYFKGSDPLKSII